MQKHTGDPTGTAVGIENGLSLYMSRYFDEYNIDVGYELEDGETSQSLIKFTVNINFTVDGKSYSGSRVLSTIDGKFKEIINANNG